MHRQSGRCWRVVKYSPLALEASGQGPLRLGGATQFSLATPGGTCVVVVCRWPSAESHSTAVGRAPSPAPMISRRGSHKARASSPDERPGPTLRRLLPAVPAFRSGPSLVRQAPLAVPEAHRALRSAGLCRTHAPNPPVPGWRYWDRSRNLSSHSMLASFWTRLALWRYGSPPRNRRLGVAASGFVTCRGWNPRLERRRRRARRPASQKPGADRSRC
jgi:hypothetical protein